MDSKHANALLQKKDALERKLKDEMTRPRPDFSLIQSIKKQKLALKQAIAFG